MTEYRLVAQAQADLDIEATYRWYENERSGLGTEFLHELRATYDRIVQGPLKYQELRSGIRRALIQRFRTLSTLRSKSKLLSCLPCFMRAAIQPSGSDAEANRPF